MVCDVCCVVCDVLFCCIVLCIVVVLCSVPLVSTLCVELCCVVLWRGVVCGVFCSLSVRAGGVLFKTRTQYQGVLGKNLQHVNIGISRKFIE